MDRILEAVAAVACLLSPEKIRALAGRIRQVEGSEANVGLAEVVSTAAAKAVVNRLNVAWQASEVNSGELASMLLAASHMFTRLQDFQRTELVWTGPATAAVATRKTEQTLLQVIDSARQSLFITSFVVYEVATIIESLKAATGRGVRVSFLLEAPLTDGGSLSRDGIRLMKALVPHAKIFTWRDRTEQFRGGHVHAKVAVADDHTCLVTSANLTPYAMERNMELGVLFGGGTIPALLRDHLQALIDTNVIVAI